MEKRCRRILWASPGARARGLLWITQAASLLVRISWGVSSSSSRRSAVRTGEKVSPGWSKGARALLCGCGREARGPGRGSSEVMPRCSRQDCGCCARDSGWRPARLMPTSQTGEWTPRRDHLGHHAICPRPGPPSLGAQGRCWAAPPLSSEPPLSVRGGHKDEPSGLQSVRKTGPRGPQGQEGAMPAAAVLSFL